MVKRTGASANLVWIYILFQFFFSSDSSSAMLVVSTTAPSPAAVGVSPGTPIVVTFNTNINPSTIS
ncbi:MAG: hypothetical protein AAF492_11315, partial [Verrucomicrobiota bacterium]